MSVEQKSHWQGSGVLLTNFSLLIYAAIAVARLKKPASPRKNGNTRSAVAFLSGKPPVPMLSILAVYFLALDLLLVI